MTNEKINSIKNGGFESVANDKIEYNLTPASLSIEEIRKCYDVSISEVHQVLKDVTPTIDGFYKYWCSEEVHKLFTEYLYLKNRIASGSYLSYKDIAQKYNIQHNSIVYKKFKGVEFITLNGCKYWDSESVTKRMKDLNDDVIEYKRLKESRKWLNLRSVPAEVKGKVKDLIRNNEYTEEQIKILYNGNRFVPLINEEIVDSLLDDTRIEQNKNLIILYDPQMLNKILEDVISEKKVGDAGRKYTIEQVSSILGKDNDYVIKEVSKLSFIEIGDLKGKANIEVSELINILKQQGYVSIKEISIVTGIHNTRLQECIGRLAKSSCDKICFGVSTYVRKDLMFNAIQNYLKAKAMQSDDLKEILELRSKLNENIFTQTHNLAVNFLENEIDRLKKTTTIFKKEEFGRSLNAIDCILGLIDKELPQYNNEEIEKLILRPELKKSHLIKAMVFINFVKNTLENECNYTKQVGLSLVEQLKKDDDNKSSESKTYTENEWLDYYIFLSNIDNHILKAFDDKRYSEIWLYCTLQLSITWRSKDIINKIPNIPLEIIEVFDFEWFKSGNSFTLNMAIKILNSVAFGLDGIVAYKNKMNLHFNIPLSLKIPTAVALTITEIHRRKNNDDIIFNSLKRKGPRHRTDFKSFFAEHGTLSNFSNMKATRTLMSLNYATAVKTIGMAGVAYVLNQYSRSHKAIDGKLSNTSGVYLNFSNLDESPEDVAYQTIELGYCGFMYSKLILSSLPKEDVDSMSNDDLAKLIKDTRTVLSPLTIEKISEQISNNKIGLDLGIDIISGMASIKKQGSEKREELIKAMEKKIIYRYKTIAKKMFSTYGEHLENFVNEKCNEIIQVFNESVGKPEACTKILRDIINAQNIGFSDFCNCIFDEVERKDKCPYSNPETCVGCKYNIQNLMQLYEVDKRLNRILDEMLTDDYLMETDYIKNTHQIDNYLFIIVQAKVQYENLDKDVLSSFINEMEIKKKIQRLQELNRIIYVDKYEGL